MKIWKVNVDESEKDGVKSIDLKKKQKKKF